MSSLFARRGQAANYLKLAALGTSRKEKLNLMVMLSIWQITMISYILEKSLHLSLALGFLTPKRQGSGALPETRPKPLCSFLPRRRVFIKTIFCENRLLSRKSLLTIG